MHKKVLFILSTLLALQAQAQYGDCVTAREICKKQTFNFATPIGEGNDKREADMISCFLNSQNAGQAEENSTWIKFEIKESGSLTFTITPYIDGDDFDFVVFRLPADGNCSQKQVVRCMASGPVNMSGGPLTREDIERSSPCIGKTGLREGEGDSSEDAGCNDPGDNAWLAPLKTVKGEKYVLLVSNVTTRGGGFSINFGGKATLGCEEPPIAKTEDKPKDKPQTTTPPAPKPKPTPPPPPVVKKPENIGGRDVEVGETVKVKTRKIKVKIWDSQIEDGDIVSIFIDDKKVLDHHRLRLKPQEFEFELPPGKEHYLTVFADDFGKSEPNTATISINDGNREQVIDLVAGRKKQESVKILSDE